MKTRQNTIHEAFAACGVLNAIDGSEDHLIQLNGVDTSLKYHVVEPEGEVVHLLSGIIFILLCTGDRCRRERRRRIIWSSYLV